MRGGKFRDYFAFGMLLIIKRWRQPIRNEEKEVKSWMKKEGGRHNPGTDSETAGSSFALSGLWIGKHTDKKYIYVHSQ